MDGVPSGGTDYFVRIREGESNIEWVELQGTLTVTNKVVGSNETVRLLTDDKTVPRMTLVGNHSWRYHYQVPTNAIGGTLSFKLVAKEHYTNATDATTWLIRTNELFTVEETVTDIPYTATLLPSNPNEISVILDDASTHLKIEYNDEQGAFSLSHASYQAFNLWTDATDGFRGNVMDGNGVSNSGVSDNKKRYDAPFDSTWTLCPEQSKLWLEDFTILETNKVDYPLNEWFSVHKTPNGWTAHNSRFVEGARDDDSNSALALDGLGEGALAMENFTKSELPLGLDSVEFTARIAQPIQFDDFATYMDGLSCSNYAISAMVTMSRQYEDATHKPTDMSPVYPSVSFVGYHRGKQGCYEFRMTRKTDTALALELYKWTRTGSGTKPTLLTSKDYTANMLVAKSTTEVGNSARTAAYFLVYTLQDGRVKLEGHLSSAHTQKGSGITGGTAETGLAASSIAFVDDNPGVLARGGSYGVGSTDCRAGFGGIRIHSVATPPAATTATSGDAVIMKPGNLEGRARLLDEWDYYTSRWEVDSENYDPNGGLSGVVPSNQVIQVWLSDATYSGSGWDNSGYEVVVNSFSTNTFTVSPRMPGSWKVRLQTGEEEDAGVVVDDVEITPWEGTEIWGRDGSAYQFLNDWAYTKAWIASAANITRNNKAYDLPENNVYSAGSSNEYVFVFNEAGTYTLVPTSDLVINRMLLVGGGGGGGAVMGGGGGGGCVRDASQDIVVPAGQICTIVVGAGGTAITGNNQNGGGNGGNSSFKFGSTTLTARGGGGGQGWGQQGSANGNSGGSANRRALTTPSAQSGEYGGHKGGDSGNGRGGGGAGAGEDGGAPDHGYTAANHATKATRDTQTTYRSVGGKGGDGVYSDITGRNVCYGGGGGGGIGWTGTGADQGQGGAGGEGGGGRGSHAKEVNKDTRCAVAGTDGLGGGGGGGTWWDANGREGNTGARGGCGTVILRVTSATRQCVLQPSRGVVDYPMGLRSPYIDEGMSLFTYSYANADSNCVLLVQIATNMTPGVGTSYVPGLTESIATNGDDVVWTTIARHDFSTMTNKGQLASGMLTTFISLRQHWIYDQFEGNVYTNVCGVIRVIVDPDIVSKVVNASKEERDALVDYGKITITKAYCYNEPALNLRSWFGWNVHTEGWDGTGGSGRFAYLTDWPDGLSIALNFSAKEADNDVTKSATLGIGLGEPEKATEYAGQNPFIQSAALTNGIGTVSFRARLFDTNAVDHRAVLTLYGGTDPAADQPTTEKQFWHVLTNFVVTLPTYQAFEWTSQAASSPYQAVRLEAAGARWGRRPSAQAAEWEWGDLDVKQEPINRVFIDEVSASELIVPRLKFLDVRPFRTNLGTEDICVITNIMSADQQPLTLESWGLQCRLEPQQMADELDTDSIRVWMEVYRGKTPWGYEQWKDLPVDNATRFSSELERVSESNLVFRSYYTRQASIMPPEETPNTVYQYVLRATYHDKSGSDTEYPAVLEAADWVVPEWYRGANVGAGNETGDSAQFSAYTILDSISPYRAWINELNLCASMNTDANGLLQFIELAVPQNANLKWWNIRFTDYNGKSAQLVKFGVDDGVRELISKIGDTPGVGYTNHYTFVSVCSPKAKRAGTMENDGYWNEITTNTLLEGVFSYQYPYGIQLVRPSGIVEHEIVMQGTNRYASVAGAGSSGTNLLAKLKSADPESKWFYVGEDFPTDNTSLGVFRSHGEDADPSCWTNYMYCTPTEVNRLKDGTLQEIPYGYFLEPLGTNIWIYSYLLKPEYMQQFYGGRNMGSSAVIMVPKGTETNLVLMVTNWYQVGSCYTGDGEEIPGARGQTGTYTLNLGPAEKNTDIFIDAEPDGRLKTDWGLTENNTYSSAVLAWLMNEYQGYEPSDLSHAHYRDLALSPICPLTLTEMYWLNIPPVHAAPHYGGSNYWLVAGMGSFARPVSGGATEQDIEPHVTIRSDGSVVSNIYLTATIMITNTSPAFTGPDRAWAPDRFNGHEYTGKGSSEWNGTPTWTSVVFSVNGALQKPGATPEYLPLQQYTFTPNSFGKEGDPSRRFQTRVEVRDPYSWGTMGYVYGWDIYRNVYPVWYRWKIIGRPDARVSSVPLEANWTPATSP